MIPEEEIILWCRVLRSECKHGGTEFHTKQVQREATGHQFREVGCWLISKFDGYSCQTWRDLQTHSDPYEKNAPVNYSLLAKGIEVNDEHSAIVESYSLHYSSETTSFPYMAETPKEVVRQFEEQVRVQR